MECESRQNPRRPLHCLLVAPVGRNLSPQSVGRVVFILQLTKNKGSGRGLGGGAHGLLWGTRIPALPPVLLTAGLGRGAGGKDVNALNNFTAVCVSFGQVTSCADGPVLQERQGTKHDSDRLRGLHGSEVMSTSAPLPIGGAFGRPRSQGFLAGQVSENSPGWCFVVPSSDWALDPCAPHEDVAGP